MYDESAENGWTDREPDVMTLEVDLLYIIYTIDQLHQM